MQANQGGRQSLSHPTVRARTSTINGGPSQPDTEGSLPHHPPASWDLRDLLLSRLLVRKQAADQGQSFGLMRELAGRDLDPPPIAQHAAHLLPGVHRLAIYSDLKRRPAMPWCNSPQAWCHAGAGRSFRISLTGQVRGWVTHLCSQRSPATVRKIHRVLSLILALAVRDGQLTRNLAPEVNLPRVGLTRARLPTAWFALAAPMVGAR